MAVLRHGLFEAADHKKLAQAVLEEKATNAGSEDSGDSHPTDAMRVKAVKARQDLKKALKLQRRLDAGEGHEFTHAEFHSGAEARDGRVGAGSQAGQPELRARCGS